MSKAGIGRKFKPPASESSPLSPGSGGESSSSSDSESGKPDDDELKKVISRATARVSKTGGATVPVSPRSRSRGRYPAVFSISGC